MPAPFRHKTYGYSTHITLADDIHTYTDTHKHTHTQRDKSLVFFLASLYHISLQQNRSISSQRTINEMRREAQILTYKYLYIGQSDFSCTPPQLLILDHLPLEIRCLIPLRFYKIFGVRRRFKSLITSKMGSH